MSTKTARQRKEAERRRYEKYQQRRQAQARRRRTIYVGISLVLVVGLVVGGTLWATGVFSSDDTTIAAPDDEPTETLTFKRAEQVLEDGPATMTLQTNSGDIVVDLNTQAAPKNSNSLAFLAQEGYFDASPCHRLTTDPTLSVLQCGSPDGSPSGGPGYTVKDENLPKGGPDNYPAATVAMAEPPGGDAGSQFFLVYEDSSLPPDYTIVGEVTKGLDVVRTIAKEGTADGGTDGRPLNPVTIETVTVDQA